MALAQQKFREIVFLSLYSNDLGKGSENDMTPLLMDELAVTRKTVKEAQLRSAIILTKLQEIDALIEKISRGYDFCRIQTVEKNVLRLGIYELQFDSDVPPKVVIAEALRITRKFATPAAAGFVNAVLDKVYRMTQGTALDDAALSQSVQALQESEEIARQISQDPAIFIHEQKPAVSAP